MTGASTQDLVRPAASELPKPGIYYDMPEAQYRSAPSWSPSVVVKGLVSMLQLDYDRRNPVEPSQIMQFGTAVHCSILEVDLFPLRYVLWGGGRRAGKEWEAFKDANEGRSILTFPW